MQESKIYSMLSLCQKAGKLYSGGFTCEKIIKSGKALITIVSRDSSPSTQKMFMDMCKYRNIPIYIFGDKLSLGKFIGKSERSVICISDLNFSEKIKELLSQL